MARWLARKKIEPKNAEEVSQRKRDEEWMGKYLLRMEKPAKTKTEKEQARKDTDWMARFMLRTRPELEENKDDEDDRRKDEAMILNFVKKIEAPAEQVASVTERRQDAALLARFLHPKAQDMTPMEEEQEFHKEEVITEFLMQHEPIKSSLKGDEMDHVAKYLVGKNLKQSQGWDKPLVTREEPKVENYVIQDHDHKKTYAGLHGLIGRGGTQEEKVDFRGVYGGMGGLIGRGTEGKLIQSEIVLERPASMLIGKKDGSPGSIRSFTSGKDVTVITDLRRMEDMAAVRIQRRWRWVRTYRKLMAAQKAKVVPKPNMLPRDKFEDLYVRFMMFCESLPYDVEYESMFRVFLFYLDESRSKRYLTQNYTETERRTYIREQYEMFTTNQVKGRAKSTLYKF